MRRIRNRINVNEKIYIEGIVREPIRERAIVIHPDQKIEEYDIEYKKSEGKFLFTFVPLKEGNYIIEINHISGYALVNVPLYVGKSFPLIPDYEDFVPILFESSSKTERKNEKDERMQVLNLINKKRKQLGAHPVELDEKLNELAQIHSDDMAKNMYSGHENRQGKNANQRAKEMGIKTLIGENVVVDSSIESAQSKLDRSPGHLKTTINLNW